MKKTYDILNRTLLVMTIATGVSAADTRVVVESQTPKWTISKYLVGEHIVYTFAPDKAYADGKFAKWTKEAGISTARYPGGTIVKYWDWKNPTGVMTGDPWDPKWDLSQNRPSEEWMSLDEYLDFVKKSGITPLFGVNSLSGYQNKKTEQSVQRAVDMVKYVKAKGYGGAFWYIGNEEASQYDGGVAGYAKVFRQHAEAMKKADPNIKIFWNLNYVDAGRIKTFLENDGGTSDGLETHGKWPYDGGDPDGYEHGTFDEWLKEVPLREKRKHYNRAWRDAADTYRKAAALNGRKNYLIANNEYGIGKGENIKGFDRYTYGLLMTDMLHEHFLGNWDMACFWDNVRGDENGLMSRQNEFRLNPFHMGMALLAAAQGGKMLDVKTDNKFVYGFAASKDDRILLYLINKTKETQALSMTITGGHFKCVGGKVMRDTPDHWGELADLTVDSGKTFKATLPALSFCQIVFQPESNKTTEDHGERPPKPAEDQAASTQAATGNCKEVFTDPGIDSGRIGLWHMFTRSARCANFRVSTPTPAPETESGF